MSNSQKSKNEKKGKKEKDRTKQKISVLPRFFENVDTKITMSKVIDNRVKNVYHFKYCSQQ